MFRWCAALALLAALTFPAGAQSRGPAYLAYAGPYAASPSSAFGHLFLVLAKHPEQPMPLWDVVTFQAVTLDASPFRYLTVGILGGFPGRFSRLPFHEKTREYEQLDDRDLWLLELPLSDAQRDALEAAIAATRDRWYPYDFFTKNCAYYLQQLLADVTGLVASPSGAVSPMGVFAAVQRRAPEARAFHRPAATRRLQARLDSLPRATAERLQRDPWRAVAADTAWLRSLSTVQRGIVQEYFGLQVLRTSQALSDETSAGLALLRVLNAQPVAPLSASRAEFGEPPVTGARRVIDDGAGREIAPPVFHGYTRVRMTQVHTQRQPVRRGVAIRGAMHDALDPWTAHQHPLSAFEMLSVALSTERDRFAPRLESAVLFSQRALAPTTWLRPRRSWLLEAVAHRGGVFGAERLHLALRGGVGRTVQGPGQSYAYALASTALVGRSGSGLTIAPGVDAGVAARLSDRLRVGATWQREHDVRRWARHHDRLRAWTRLDVGSRAGVHVAVEQGTGGRGMTVGVDVYR